MTDFVFFVVSNSIGNKMENLINTIKQNSFSYTLYDYYGALSQIKKESVSSLKKIKVAILRSYSTEMLEPVLAVHLTLFGYDLELFFGDYNQYAQEILDGDSLLYQFSPDIIMMLVRHEELLPEFNSNFANFNGEEWIKKIDETIKNYQHLIQMLSQQSKGSSILVQNFALMNRPFLGVFDAQRLLNQSFFINKLNQMLSSVAESHPNVRIWAFDQLIAEYGWSNLYDPKLDYYAHNPFKPNSYAVIGRHIMQCIGSILGKQKKCIVLDLDNTLWGGVVGEAGLSGIKLDHEYPGNCYVAFQKQLLKMTYRGIILAVNSKNNLEDVNEVFLHHPHMILRKNHIVAERVNWINKVTNLREIARELNIGLDSLIFIDDNPAECELVRAELPEVNVILLPNKPYLIPQVLDQLISEIENIRITSEDTQKTVIYQAQVCRVELENNSVDLNGFLSSLNMTIRIASCDDFSISRIAQLTQKTNQFNLTTKRYTEADILNMVESESYYVFYVSAMDKFGDHGIIGVFILRIDMERAYIDTLLLSCRVISRTIEQSILAFIEEFCMEKQCTQLIGQYIPTNKNKQVSDLYKKFGFLEKEQNNYYLAINQSSFLHYSPHIRLDKAKQLENNMI